MNYGLYLSASGVLTNLYRQDVFANNLANVKTVGFKPDMSMVRQRDPESVESDAGFELSQPLLDRLGGGVFAGPQHIDFRRGNFEKTRGDLDVALDAPDTFFAVSVSNPQTNQLEVQLTRDGRFVVDHKGYLVTAVEGHRVLDPGDQPIHLDPNAAAKIAPSSAVVQNEVEVARIQVATVVDTDRLLKQGGTRFRLDGPDSLRRVVERPKLHAGFVEASGADPIKALMNVIAATKRVTGNGNLIRYHDLLMDRAVNVLGRVSA